jgi:hypothetical protein
MLKTSGQESLKRAVAGGEDVPAKSLPWARSAASSDVCKPGRPTGTEPKLAHRRIFWHARAAAEVPGLRIDVVLGGVGL